ncbi:hypothetical protein U1Q18_036582 [Sarracenia purpurea var. burkii]
MSASCTLFFSSLELIFIFSLARFNGLGKVDNPQTSCHIPLEWIFCQKSPPDVFLLMHHLTFFSPDCHHLTVKKKSSHSVDSSTLKSLSSIMDIMDSSGKLPNTHDSHQNLSRSILLRHPRHYFGRQYSRRSVVNNTDASSSRGNATPDGEKLSFKFASQCNSDYGRHAENEVEAFCRPERIRPGSSGAAGVVSTAAKMVCGICEKLLKKRPYILGNGLSSGDISVVAVLVCGHVYHADCLEQRTCHEDTQDPPCPLCEGLLSKLGGARGQK